MRNHGLRLLCPLLLLTACATQAPIVRTETVTVHVPVAVPVADELTAPVAEPNLASGGATNEDLLALIDALREWGRDGWGRLAEIRGLQPEPKP